MLHLRNCDICDKDFFSHSNLLAHLYLVHLQAEKAMCPYDGCGKVFMSKATLKNHIDGVHLGEWRFICEEGGCTSRPTKLHTCSGME